MKITQSSALSPYTSLAGDESELLSQGTPRRSLVNPQQHPTPSSGGKPDGRENKRIVPGKAKGAWLRLSRPRMELHHVNMLLEQSASPLAADQRASKGCMHIPPAWHGTSTLLLAFHTAQETNKASLTLARVSKMRNMKLNLRPIEQYGSW